MSLISKYSLTFHWLQLSSAERVHGGGGGGGGVCFNLTWGCLLLTKCIQ